jgi:hypothetical protein
MTPTIIGTESRFFTGLFDDREKIMAGSSMLAFFTRGETMISPYAEDFDDKVIRGNKKIAAMVPRAGAITRHMGSTMITQKPGPFSSISRRFPLALEYFTVESSLLNKMTPMETPYQNLSKQDRLRWYVMKGLEESMRRLADLANVLAGQSMRLGVQDAILGTSNIDEQYDWYRLAANTITAAGVWTNPAADVIGDIDDACIQVHKKGRAVPDILCLSNAAFAGFRQNTRIIAEADNRRFESVNLEGASAPPPDHSFLTSNGWIYRGKLITDEGYELYIYTTQDYYEDNSGNVINIMPDAQGFVTSSKAKFDRFFGPPKTLDLTTAQVQWWIERFGIDPRVPATNDRVPSGIIPRDAFFLWGEESMGSIDMWVQFAPIFKTTQTDAVATLTSLV